MSDGSISPGDRRFPRSGPVVLMLALLPSVSAVWLVPGFVTQDGPSHVYNAHILLESLRLGADSPFSPVFEPRWRPLPNLGGHVLLMGLLAVLPPQESDRAMTTLSMVGFALAIVWLRWRVAGRWGLSGSTVLAVLLAINMPWLMGFSNFLVGSTLMLLTVGLWWRWRDAPTPGRSALIGAMLVLGYFGHLVSLGLTVFSLVVLASTAPGTHRRRRFAWTLASCLPMIPMAVLYKMLTAEGGAFEPVWEQSGPILSPSLWARRLSWIDPIALGRRDLVPLIPGLDGPGGLALSPSLWLGLGLLVAIVGMALPRVPLAACPPVLFPVGVSRPRTFRTLGGNDCRGRSSWQSGAPAGSPPVAPDLDGDIQNGPLVTPGDRPCWVILSALLLVGSAVGPDGFGDDHGYFLSQRVALVGLACLVPALDLDLRRWSGRLATGLIVVALALQSAFVWDYAIESDRRAGAILRAAPEIGRGARVGTLLVDIRGRYRSNPLLHADCLLGVDSGNVVWSNYETRHYYFPVQLRPGLDAPPSPTFERVALLDSPDDADERARLWAELLRNHGRSIDVVLSWGLDPDLEAINARWAGSGPVLQSGAVRVYRRGGSRAVSSRLRPQASSDGSTARPGRRRPPSLRRSRPRPGRRGARRSDRSPGCGRRGGRTRP